MENPIPPPAEPSLPAQKKSGFAETFGALLVIGGILIFLSLSSFQSQISKGQEPIPEYNLIGNLGHYSAELFFLMFGKSAFLIGPYFMILGSLTIFRGGFSDPLSRLTAILIMTIGSSILSAMLHSKGGIPSQVAGGLIGMRMGNVLQNLFGGYGTGILALGILMGGVFLAIRMPISLFIQKSQLLVIRFLKRYVEIFSGQMNASYSTPSPASYQEKPREDLRQHFTENFIHKESGTQRPWIEKVEQEEPDTSATSDDEAKQPQSKKPRPDMLRISDHTRSLQALLAQMGQRYKGEKVDAPAPKEKKEGRSLEEPNYYFEGYFDPDGSRFHFRNTFLDSPRFHSGHTAPKWSFVSLAEPRGDASPRDLRILERAPLQNHTDTGRNSPIPPAPSSAALGIGISSLTKKQPGTTDSASLNPESQLQPLPASSKSSGYSPELFPQGPEEPEGITEKETVGLELSPTEAATKLESQNSPIAPNSIEPPSYKTSDETDCKADYEPDEFLHSQVPSLFCSYTDYRLSPDLLHKAKSVPQNNIIAELNEVREGLEKVMREYNIQAEVVDTQRGPIITLYEIKLEPGIKVMRILGIQNEICMNLAVPIVRIIAPIPGKSTIGIEIPNRVREPVLFSQLLPVPEGNLKIVLGKNIAGENQYAELTQLPHLLIAGSTGAGKSVYLNAVIASLLYHSSPEDMRFVMIDPKMVELKLYDGIPHLLMPVITDVYQASKALRWLIDEMERRYKILSALRCRDIRSYNTRIQKEYPKPNHRHNKMPYIIVLIDELSDLMMIAAKDVEDSIIRLTQKARAVGIHIIMATQRPSVDVITALIKANCPARIAFQVAQRTDSRTILDANGAENLLGKGDLLYKSPHTTTLTRLQAPLVSEEEIEGIVQQARSFGAAAYVDLDSGKGKGSPSAEEEVDEDLFQEALAVVMESGKTSTSYLQRRMRLGYNRAANLIEMMEDRGYLSPPIGNKQREILKRLASTKE